jgi:hypothetical protein
VTRAIDLAGGDHEPARWHFRFDGADYLVESDGHLWSLAAGPESADTIASSAARDWDQRRTTPTSGNRPAS